MFRTPSKDSCRTSTKSNDASSPLTSPPNTRTSPTQSRAYLRKGAGAKTQTLNSTFETDPTGSMVRRLSGDFEKKIISKTAPQTDKTTAPVKISFSQTAKPKTGPAAKPKPQVTDVPEITASDIITKARDMPAIEGLLEVVSFASDRIGDTKNMKGEIKRDLCDCLKHLKLSLEVMKTTRSGTPDKRGSQERMEISMNEEWKRENERLNLKLEDVLSEMRALKEQGLRSADAILSGINNINEGSSYAKRTTTPQEKSEIRPTLYSVIVSSKNDQDTGEAVLEQIREVVDAKEGWVKVTKIRKAKDRKVIMSCETKEEKQKIKERIDRAGTNLVAEEAKNKDPLVIALNILKVRTDTEVLEALRKQNKQIFQDLSDEDGKVSIKYKKRARNPHTQHMVLTVSPKIWSRLTNAGYIHIDLQRIRIEDQSPLIQCSQCLGYGHSKTFCKEREIWCSHCGCSGHIVMDCPTWTDAGSPPSCRNCCKAQLTQREHNAFSRECPVRKKWDRLARQAVAYC